jgi:hypothetical protein
MNGNYKYLLDSNIIIYHLNGEKPATDFLIANFDKCAISRITYIEVLSYPFNENDFKIVKEFLESFKIIDTDKEISDQSIINRRLKKIKLPDNIIAATAQVNNLILVTRNVKDFNLLAIKLLNIFE